MQLFLFGSTFCSCLTFLLCSNVSLYHSNHIYPEEKSVLMSFFNKHRNNANISNLTWDLASVSLTDNDSKNQCNGKQTSYELLYVSVPSKNKSANMAEQLKNMLDEAYLNFTSQYEYSGDEDELDKLLNCYRGKQGDNVELSGLAMWVGHWIRPSVQKFGCVSSNCSKVTEYKLYQCVFDPIQLFPEWDPLFPKKNFLKMCKIEPGQWRSCERDLQNECLTKSGKQIDQNDNSNAGDYSEQNRESNSETEKGSTSSSRVQQKTLVNVLILPALIISAQKLVC